MERHYGNNYDAFKALHDARLQAARTSAAAAGLASRHRHRVSLLERVRRVIGVGGRLRHESGPRPRPETIFRT